MSRNANAPDTQTKALQQTPPPPTTLPSTIPNCSCQETPSPKPPISACYTCTRAVNRHRQLRPRLRRLAELFDTANGDHAPLMRVGDDGRGAIAAPEDADLSLLQRFLLCSENEAPSLLALGSGAGALNISAARNYERKVGA